MTRTGVGSPAGAASRTPCAASVLRPAAWVWQKPRRLRPPRTPGGGQPVQDDLAAGLGFARTLRAPRHKDLVRDGHGDRFAVDRQCHGTTANDPRALVRHPNVEVVGSRLGSEGMGSCEGHVCIRRIKADAQQALTKPYLFVLLRRKSGAQERTRTYRPVPNSLKNKGNSVDNSISEWECRVELSRMMIADLQHLASV